MRKEERIKALREDLPALKSRYGGQSIGSFGSCATGKNTGNRGLDILANSSAPLTNDHFELWAVLERRFQKKIDWVRKGSHLSEGIPNTVHAGIVYACV